MNDHVLHYSGPEIDKFNEISDKLDKILGHLEKDEVMNMLINYMAHGLLKCSKEPFEEIIFWAKTFVETFKLHAEDRNRGTMQ